MEIDDADAEVMIVTIATPAGVVDLIGAVRVLDGVLTIDRVHVQGLTPGALGRSGLNAIGRKLMVEADVCEIVIQGGTRTTGRNKGRKPRAIWLPHQAAAERPRRRGPSG